MKTIAIAGRLGRDAELRRTQQGESVCSFSVAANDGKDRPAIWFDCSIWGRRGEALAPHLLKGSSVAVSGDLGRREHNGKTYFTVRVSEVALMGGRSQDAGASAASPSDDLDDDVPF